jgi:hypothetical protein
LLRRRSVADRALAELASLVGVSGVTVNTATGSLLVTYDPKCLQPEVVWMKLREVEVVAGTMPTSAEDSIGQLRVGVSFCPDPAYRSTQVGLVRW